MMSDNYQDKLESMVEALNDTKVTEQKAKKQINTAYASQGPIQQQQLIGMATTAQGPAPVFSTGASINPVNASGMNVANPYHGEEHETSERELLYKILRAQGVILSELHDLRGEIDKIKSKK